MLHEKMNASSVAEDMFRPPANRAMRVLDRSFFKKKIVTSVARIKDPRQIANCRKDLHHEILKLDRMPAVKSVQDSQGAEAKALLLRPEIKPDGKPLLSNHGVHVLTEYIDRSTWSSSLSDLVNSSQVSVMPYDLMIDYDYWTYRMYVKNPTN